VTDAPRFRLGTLVKQLLVLLIVLGVGFFFWRAIRQNWAQIQAHRFVPSYGFITLAFVTVVVSSLLATYAWQVTLNELSGKRDMTFAKSVATVNTTSLTKYLPGKFWSYALQMYWLARSGYSKAFVLYVNLTNLAVSLVTGVLLAVAFLFVAGTFAGPLVTCMLAVVVLADLICIRYWATTFKLFAALATKIFKREVGYFEMPTRLMLRIHGIQLLAQIVSAAGGYALCFGLGYSPSFGIVLLIMASLILADTAGFVFFMVPAGLGVREGTMYLLLHNANTGSLALVLPLVTRALYMVADVLLGLVALWLLRRSARASEAERVVPSG
jgi:hypothetical protein